MERTKANNQFFGKAFEILVVETLTGKTPENSVLEKFSDLSGIRADKIGAKYEDGVLKLTLPKKEEKVPATRRLEIE